jgi:hypothetical protein
MQAGTIMAIARSTKNLSIRSVCRCLTSMFRFGVAHVRERDGDSKQPFTYLRRTSHALDAVFVCMF